MHTPADKLKIFIITLEGIARKEQCDQETFRQTLSNAITVTSQPEICLTSRLLEAIAENSQLTVAEVNRLAEGGDCRLPEMRVQILRQIYIFLVNRYL